MNFNESTFAGFLGELLRVPGCIFGEIYEFIFSEELLEEFSKKFLEKFQRKLWSDPQKNLWIDIWRHFWKNTRKNFEMNHTRTSWRSPKMNFLTRNLCRIVYGSFRRNSWKNPQRLLREFFGQLFGELSGGFFG